MPPLLGALLAVVFWGVSFVATASVVRELSPVTLVFARTAIGLATLVAVQVRRGEPILPPREAFLALAALGFLGITFHQGVQAYALTLTSVVNTGWLIGLVPVWAALLSAALGKERFGPQKVLGLGVGFAGALLVITRGRLAPDLLALPSTRGDLLVLLSTVTWAIYSVTSGGLVRRLGPERATIGAMLIGELMFAPIFLAGGGGADLARLSPGGIGALLFLGIACSGLGYLWWYAALARRDPAQVAALLYLEPLVTLAAAVALLHEPVGLATLAGGGLVAGGVALVQRA